ncbi:MAG: FtsX-like permease family protein [Lachnospiraceae bacterium]
MKNINRLSNLALIIGFTLTLLAVINGFAVAGYAEQEDNIRAKYLYRYLNTVRIYDEEMNLEKYDEFFSSLNDSDSNRGLLLQVYIGESEADASDTTVLYIYYDCQIPLLQKLMEGTLPGENTENKPAVAIGYEYEQYTYERDDKSYILINGVECIVTGIIGALNVEYSSGIIFSTPDALGENVQKAIMEPCLRTQFGRMSVEAFEETDEQTNVFESVEEQYKYVYDETKFGIRENTMGSIDRGYHGEAEESNNKMFQMFFMTLAMFALAGSFALSGLWFSAHKKEIAVRKLWGYSVWQLAENLFKKLGTLALVSLVTAFLIQIPITFLWREGFDLFGYLNVSQVLVVVGIMVFITVVMSVIELKRSKRITPADALRKYEY